MVECNAKMAIRIWFNLAQERLCYQHKYPVCIKLNQISSPTLVDEPFEKLSRLSLRILRLTLHHHPQLKLKKNKNKKKLFWIFDLNQLFILSQISVFILTACFWGVLLQ